MTTVSVTAWQLGFKTISFVKLLREGSQSQRTLNEAKSMVDGLSAGKPFTVDFPDLEEAETFLKSAADLGAVAGLMNTGAISGTGYITPRPCG